MVKVNLPGVSGFVKKISEFFTENILKKGIFHFFSQWKTLLLILTIEILFIFIGGFMWNDHQEIIILRNEIDRLNTENSSLRDQLITQPVGKDTGDMIQHKVQSGESFSKISLRYYGTENYATHLAKLNGISLDSQLNVDQVVKVPRVPDQSWTIQEN